MHCHSNYGNSQHDHPQTYELVSRSPTLSLAKASNPGRAALLTVTDVENSGSLCIDGFSFVLGEVDRWGQLSSGQVPWDPTLLHIDSLFLRLGSGKRGDAIGMTTPHECTTYTFWADSVICTFPSRDRSPGTAQVVGCGARLVNARVRSMHALFDGLSETSYDNPRDPSQLLANLEILLSGAVFRTVQPSRWQR